MPMLPPNEFAESLRAIMSNMVHRSDAITAAASSSVVVRGGAATAAPTTSLQYLDDKKPRKKDVTQKKTAREGKA